jgi:D-lactate dehydrogenase (cytochrome)
MAFDPSVLRAESRVGVVTSPPAGVHQAPDPATISDFLHDESKLSATGVASLATPASVAELRAILAWHAHEHHAVTVSGARTGVAGGAVPEPGSHLVSLVALRGVLRVVEGEHASTATVLAGTTLAELNDYLAAHHPDLTFPVDPTETSASIGGMVATNAGGARSFRFGAVRGWVAGLTVELPSARTLTLSRGVERVKDGALLLEDGEPARHLAIPPIPKPATKNAIGYGLDADGSAIDLWIGAEGTLGVVSEVVVRLRRRAGGTLGYLQFFETPDHAFRFVHAVRGDSTVGATSIEFLDARSHALARESGKPAVARVLHVAPAGTCSVFTEAEYRDEEELQGVAGRLSALASAAGGEPHASLAGVDAHALRDVRTFRHAVPESINAIIARRRATHPSLHKIATDMAVPDDALAWVFDRYRSVLGGEGLDFAIFGHVGDNHFHVNILPRDEEEMARARACYALLAREVVARGGAVAAEHGIGRIKKRFLPIQYSPQTMSVLRAIKRWVDPEWRFNQGILIDP